MKFQKFGVALIPCLALFTSCEDDTDKKDYDNYLPKGEEIEISVNALYSTNHKISEKAAETEALEASKWFIGNGERTVTSVMAIKSGKQNSSIALPDTIAYAVNFADLKGFALIAADDRSINRVLFCTEYGGYDSEEIKANVEIANMIEKATQRIEYNITDFETYKEKAKQYCDTKQINGDGSSAITSVTESEGPYLLNLWGQLDEYSAQCHKCSKCEEKSAVGCAQLSIAQVMSYYKKPNQLSDGYTIDWDKVLEKKWIYKIDSTSKKDLQHLLGFIQKKCGKNILQFGCLEHGGTLANFNTNLKFIDYKVDNYNDLNADNGSKLFTLLQQKKSPLIVTDDYHGWVADGYKALTKDIETLTIDPYGNITTASEAKPQNYVHYNWGWDGLYNGYYELGIVHIPALTKKLNGTPQFNRDSKKIYYIRPE